MPTFRKKPVEVEAVQFTHENRDIIEGYEEVFAVSFPVDGLAGDAHAKIQTEEGVLRVDRGDWIITGVEGERYPCKPEIFEQTYERPGEPAPAERADGKGLRAVDVHDLVMRWRSMAREKTNDLPVEMIAAERRLRAAEALSQCAGELEARYSCAGHPVSDPPDHLPVKEEGVEAYIRHLDWGDDSTEYQRTLVAGNIRTFWHWLMEQRRGRMKGRKFRIEIIDRTAGGEPATADDGFDRIASVRRKIDVLAMTFRERDAPTIYEQLDEASLLMQQAMEAVMMSKSDDPHGE